MSRECRSSETYDTAHLDLLKNSLVVLRNRCHKRVSKVYTFYPLVSLHINLDVCHIVTGEVLARSH